MATIGFIQGRLSSIVDGRIQAFPWDEWRDEFPRAAALGFRLMEWTLDADRLDENPLLAADEQREIHELSQRYGVTVGSLTGDFLMQASPLAASGATYDARVDALERVIDACGTLGIRYIIWPLVDQGRLGSPAEADALVDLVTRRLAPRLLHRGVRLAFESDYPPAALAALVARLPGDLAGVNYDTGNSASLGFKPSEELSTYGHRVVNVHVKDRRLGGTTVPLGMGAADFAAAFRGLHDCGYAGAWILQTARAADDDHGGALVRYREFVCGVMSAL